MAGEKIQKQNIDSKKQNESVEIKVDSKEKFIKIIESSSLKSDTKENLKKILLLINIKDLEDFIIGNPDLDDIINGGKEINISLKDLETIIDDFLLKFGETKTTSSAQEKARSDKQNSEIKDNTLDKRISAKKIEQDTQSQGLELLAKNDSKYREIFKGDVKIISILDEIQTNKEHPEKIAELLNKFLENKENATKFFDKIAKSGDAQLYTETRKSFENLGVTIPAHIPREIYKVLDIPEPIPKAIISQFPGVKPEDIEKRGNLVSYRDKTINLETGKAYISGEKGYAIETSMQVPNSLDLRVEYQKERLEILDDIETNKKILNLVENKKHLKENLEKLKKDKENPEKKHQNDLELDIEITRIEKEIEIINSKLKVIPGYNEDHDENLIIFLEEQIEKSKESLKSLKEKFDEDMQELLEVGKDEIIEKDKKVKETISFLDDLGITNINQNDLQKIINRININPQVYGFEKKIDLKKGFEGTPTDTLKTKREIFNLFSKVYEKMNFKPPVSENIVEGFTKDTRLKEDTIFKQKLEDIGVTKGGSLQIETFMEMIKPKPEKKEEKSNK